MDSFSVNSCNFCVPKGGDELRFFLLHCLAHSYYSFGQTLRIGLWVTNSSFFIWECTYFPFTLEEWFCCLWSLQLTILSLLLTFAASDKKSTIIQIGYLPHKQIPGGSPTGNVSFLCEYFWYFPFDLVLQSLSHCLHVHFFFFLVLLCGFYSAFWICRFMSIGKFGKFSAINIF